MKPLIPILVVATTSLAVASVQFAQQASTQRKRADAEQAVRQQQQQRIAELEGEQARLQRELADAQSLAATRAAEVEFTDEPAAAKGAASTERSRVASAESGPRPVPPPFMRGGRPPGFGSPAMQKMMRSRMKLNVRRMYEGVGPALGLSQDKANELMDLLADQQTRNVGRPPDTDGKPMQEYMNEMQQKNQAEIAALIGQNKLDEWASFQKSLPDRSQLNQVREQLEASGAPMTDSQRTQMLAAMSEERDRLPRPVYSAGLPQQDFIAQQNQWQSDYDEALLQRAQQILTSEQYKSYKEYQGWQSEMRKSFTVLSTGRANSSGGAVVGMAAPVGQNMLVAPAPGSAVAFGTAAPFVPAEPDRR